MQSRSMSSSLSGSLRQVDKSDKSQGGLYREGALVLPRKGG